MTITEALFLLCVVQFMFLVYQQWMFDKERRQLLNRIMAKDYNEYAHTKPGGAMKPAANHFKQAVSLAEQRRRQGWDEDGEG